MDLFALARQKASQYGLDPEIFFRQIKQESNFNPRAVSSAGAMGLGQLMPATARGLGLVGEDVWNPEKNLDAAARYMKQMVDLSGGDVTQGLIKYNRGPAAKGPLPAETRQYVARIMGTPELRTAPPVSLLGELRSRIAEIGLPRAKSSAGMLPPVPTLPPAPLSDLPEIATAQPVGFKEWLYSHLIGNENEGLPAPKQWPGTDYEPLPGPTTSDLLGLGLNAAAGMSAPASQLLKNYALSAGGGAVGGEIGEALGGDTGRQWGEMIGSNVPVFPGFSPGAFKKDVVAIPPIGPLEGTKVLTKEGLARPVGHGTPHVYDMPDFSKMRDPEGLLYGPGYYSSTALKTPGTPLEGYSRVFSAGSPSDIQRKLKTAKSGVNLALRDRNKAMQQIQQALPAEEAHSVINVAREFAGRPIEEFHKYLDAAEKQHPPSVIDGIEKLRSAESLLKTAPFTMSRLRTQMTNPTADQPNIRPMYMNIKSPIDMDKPLGLSGVNNLISKMLGRLSGPDHERSVVTREGIKQALSYLMNEKSSDLATKPANEIYHLLNQAMSKTEINNMLRVAGYDGITHIGGAGAGPGNMPHRVYIAFSPDQVKPYFSPEFSDAQAQRVAAIAAKKQLAQQRQLEALQKKNAQLKRNLGITE